MPITISNHLKSVNSTLRAFSLNLTGDMLDAEDLYQDTAVRIIDNVDKFKPDNDFQAWAVTIMRNLFINNYRKKIRKNIIIDQTSNGYYLNLGNGMEQNQGAENLEYQELLKMVNNLSEDYRVPFWMMHQGYKYGEVAEYMNLPIGTVKSRIFFARKKLQYVYNKERVTF